MAVPTINVAHIVPRTEAEGPGVRYAVWGQGCPLRCSGCCNPEMLPFVERTRWDPLDLAEHALASKVEGLTFLGGEPFAQALGFALAAERAQAHGLSVMVFSGFTRKVLEGRADEGARRLLAATDLLVDGPYRPELRTTRRRFIGSSNQVLHFLTGKYGPEDPRFSAPNHLEIRLSGGFIELNGWPIDGAQTKIG